MYCSLTASWSRFDVLLQFDIPTKVEPSLKVGVGVVGPSELST